MMTEVATITHTSEGIRFNWPDSTSSVFPNAVLLAESFARLHRSQTHAHEQINGEATELMHALESLLVGKSEPLAKLKALRESLQEASRMLC